MPRTATSDEIKEEFTSYGLVEHVKILVDRATGESKVYNLILNIRADPSNCLKKIELEVFERRVYSIASS